MTAGQSEAKPSNDQRLIRCQQIIAEICDSDVSRLGNCLTNFIQDMLAGHSVTQTSRYTRSRFRLSIMSRIRDNEATAMKTGCR